MYSGVYTMILSATAVTSAITVVQVRAGSLAALDVIRAWVGQGAGETSTQEDIALIRKSTAATVSSKAPVLLQPANAAAQAIGTGSGTGVNATVEGTDGDILVREGFNVLNGWLYLPVLEERPRVAPNGTVALKFMTVPASQPFTAGITWGELG